MPSYLGVAFRLVWRFGSRYVAGRSAERMARPAKEVPWHVRFPTPLLDRLRAQARREDRKIPYVVREAVEFYLVTKEKEVAP